MIGIHNTFNKKPNHNKWPPSKMFQESNEIVTIKSGVVHKWPHLTLTTERHVKGLVCQKLSYFTVINISFKD